MFRFTIRDVLWLTVVMALVVAMWIARQRSNERVGQINAAFEQEKKSHAAEILDLKKVHAAEILDRQKVHAAKMFIELQRHQTELKQQQMLAELRAKGILPKTER